MIPKINIREILRQILVMGFTNTAIALALCVAPNTVRRYRSLVTALNFQTCQLEQLDDKQLHDLFNKRLKYHPDKRMPDWTAVYEAVANKGEMITDQWEMYSSEDPDSAYSYPQFTHHYRTWRKLHSVTMRFDHLAGESAFVDFAGKKKHKKPFWIEHATGKKHEVEMFVSCLGASDNMFACATASQKERDWIEANVRMLEFYGGVPKRIVCDNLKAAVIRPGRFPVLNQAYLDFADHYGTTIAPARSKHPKDKAKVENAVKLIQRWLIPYLLRMTFFSIDEMNAAILELLKKINDRPFRAFPGTRRSRFETLEKPALRPLPAQRHEFAEWTAPQKVGSDYRIRVKDHFYSVPFMLIGESVRARVSTRTVEIIHNGRRIASHVRDDTVGEFSRIPEHMPQKHRFYAQATPENLLAWAQTVGPHTFALCEQVYGHHHHPQPATNFCLALQRFVEDGIDTDTLEAAALYAMERRIYSMDRFRSIVRRQAKGLLTPRQSLHTPLPPHENVRGETYYR